LPLTTGAAEIEHRNVPKDPTQIRPLTKKDVVTRSIDKDRANKLNPWTLTTASTVADQQIGSYTVSAGKTFRIQAVLVEVHFTTLSTTAEYLGTLKLQIGGSDWLGPFQASNTTSGALFGMVIPIPEGVDVAEGVVIRALCTPAVTTSIRWVVTLIGFER